MSDTPSHPFRPGQIVQKASGERALVLGVYPKPGQADEIALRTVEGFQGFPADSPMARLWAPDWTRRPEE